MGARLPIAFLAGFASVITPCVLPLVPGYLAALSSVEAGRLAERGSARRVVTASVPFILGFTVVFVVLGAGAAAIGGSVSVQTQTDVAGFVPSCSASPFSARAGAGTDRRTGLLTGARRRAPACCSAAPSPSARHRASASCSRRCSSSRATRNRLRGAVLLAAYALGLGAAFILAGIAFARAMGAFRWLRDHYMIIQAVSGVILVALGLLLFFHRDWWLHVALNRALEAVGLSSP